MDKFRSTVDRPIQLRRQATASQVADELRRRIITGEIPQGTQLPQEQVAAEFGVSKVPVREALFQLEAEGFVVQQFHRTAVVSGLGPDEIMEIFELRSQIEAWLLGLAMGKATAEDCAEAERLAIAFEKEQDVETSWSLNWQFHEALYRPARKPYIVEHLKKLHFKVGLAVRLHYDQSNDKAEIAKEHHTILSLFRKKDERAKEALTRHIENAIRNLVDRLRKLPR